MANRKGCKDKKPRKRRPKVQFCPKGHNTFIVGRYGSRCKVCANEASCKRQKALRVLRGPILRKKQRVCKRGHDTSVLGKDKWGHCMECCRIRNRIRQKTDQAKEYRKKFNRTPKRRKYVAEYNKKYRKEHWKALRAYERDYKKKHPEQYKLAFAKNKTNRRFRYVSWGQEGILDFIKYKPVNIVIDHIIPLQGKFISGLNVIWNLQYLTPKANGVKLNNCDVLEASEWYGKILEEAGLK